MKLVFVLLPLRVTISCETKIVYLKSLRLMMNQLNDSENSKNGTF